MQLNRMFDTLFFLIEGAYDCYVGKKKGREMRINKELNK